MTAPVRPVPEPLELRCPDCSLCGAETLYDEGFLCGDCGAWWPERIGDPGRWMDEDAPQCGEFLTHGGYPRMSGRCVLSVGHRGEHNNGHTTWNDETLKSHQRLGWTSTTEWVS